MRRLMLCLLVVASFQRIQAQESAQYLQNAIRDLRYMKGRQTLQRVDTTAMVQEIVPEPSTPPTTPVSERRIQNNNAVPPLSLTKGELAALYEAAVSKGETVKLKAGDNTFVHAAVHELEDSPSYVQEQASHPTASSDPGSTGDASGYYYYYYPIKSFLDEMSSQPSSHEHQYSHPSHHEVIHTTIKPQYQYHSHTHQHNVKITSTKVAEEKKDKKALEPLFMAISGFIGMAVMFVLSVLVFPKFGIKKPKGSFKGNIKKNERITDIARVALQAIEGKDCVERFACELEKTARAFNLQENRFVKLLKRMAPGSFGKQMDKIGKFNKRLRCTAIPCKKKNPPKKKPNKGVQKKT